MIIGSKKGWHNLRQKTSKASGDSKITDYKERDILLESIGFFSYQDYLQSGVWKHIRGLQIKSHPNCIACGNEAEEVHHTRYDKNTMLGIGKIDVVSLCRKCHLKIEFTNGRKSSLYEANGNLMDLCQKKSMKELLFGQLKIQKNDSGKPDRRDNLGNSRKDYRCGGKSDQTPEARKTARRIVGFLVDMGAVLGRLPFNDAVSRVAKAIDFHVAENQ